MTGSLVLVIVEVLLLAAIIFAFYRGRHRSSGELTEAWLRRRELYENDAPMAYITCDPADARVIRCNRAAARLLGYREPPDLVGRPLLDLCAPTPAGRKKASSLFSAAGPCLEVHDQELQLLMAGGEPIWARVTSRQLYDPAGNLTGYRLAISDITAQKKADERLRESEERYKLLFECSRDAIFIVDPNTGRYLDANASAERLTGLPRTEIGKRAIGSLTDGGSGERFDSARSEDPTDLDEVTYVRPDGTRRIALLGILPAGNVTLGIAVDITDRRRDEEALRESEKKYSDIVEQVNDGIVIIQDGLLVFANSKAGEIVGSTPVDIIGRPFAPFVAEEDRQRTLDNYRSRMSGGAPPERYEFSLLSKEGSPVPVETNVRAVEYKGRPAVMAVARDITERRRAEDRLRESEERYRLLFERSHDAIFLVDTRTGQYLDANASAVELTGRSLAEIKTFTTLDLTPAGAAERLDRARRGQAPTLDEISYQRPDGTRRTALLSVVLTNTEVAFGIAHDITERKRAEEKLREQQELMSCILGSTPNAVVVISDDRRLVMANRAFYTMFELDEVRGEQCTDLFAVPGLDEGVRRTLRLRTHQRLEVRHRLCGRERVLTVDLTPLTGSGRGVGEALVILSDVTAERIAQERFFHAERLASIGQTASGIAHEISNPLTSVVGFAEVLLSRDLPPDLRKGLETIHRNAERAVGVTRNLLSFVRKQSIERMPTNLNDLIRQVLELRGYEMKTANIAVEAELEPDLPPLLADTQQIKQVFMNIVLNAEDAMAEANGRGVLAVRSARDGDMLRVTFADDGPGIPTEDLTRVFEPFFTTKPPGKGTGLGLNICDNIVTSHGGRIWAESDPGRGATFVVQLPISLETS